ncbi:MAG: hypothetical protein JWQ19_1805 [Subtercola sp.]|nr:hypothetical protein [Subtercola sp.]
MNFMTAESDFASIADDLAPAGVVLGQMFGAKALYFNGKALGCLLRSNNAVFKLGRASAAHAEALTIAGATLFYPGGGTKAFKDWVEVPEAQSPHWPELAEAALNAATATL